MANFAYDPINYDFLRNLKVLDLFLDNLAESDQVLQKFAICGLCNLCLGKFTKVFYRTLVIYSNSKVKIMISKPCVLDPQNKEYIIHNEGVPAVAQCLTSSDEQTVLAAITTLMYLLAPESKACKCEVNYTTRNSVSFIVS